VVEERLVEKRRHTFDTFLDEKPSIAQGGGGVVIPDRPACGKRINTMSQFLDHLVDDVLPGLLEIVAKHKLGTTYTSPFFLLVA
jgi:hypothetical protein